MAWGVPPAAGQGLRVHQHLLGAGQAAAHHQLELVLAGLRR
jgi:hypothetical protein